MPLGSIIPNTGFERWRSDTFCVNFKKEIVNYFFSFRSYLVPLGDLLGHNVR